MDLNSKKHKTVIQRYCGYIKLFFFRNLISGQDVFCFFLKKQQKTIDILGQDMFFVLI